MNRTFNLSRYTVISRRYITLGGHKPNLSNTPKLENNDDLITHAPKWEAKYATESEADVKADNEPVSNMEELKERSAAWLKRHKSDNVEMDIE